MILHKKGAGADSVIPFSGGSIAFVCNQYNGTGTGRCYSYCMNTDGTVYQYTNQTISDIVPDCDFISLAMNGSSVYTMTVKKAGYYLSNMGSASSANLGIRYQNVNDSIYSYGGSYPIIYLGESNPFA